MSSVAAAVSQALPVPATDRDVDLRALQRELDDVAEEAVHARRQGIPIVRAVRDEAFPGLRRFHRDLRDALFVEIPDELDGWVGELRQGNGAAAGAVQSFAGHLSRAASGEGTTGDHQLALAELLVFEAIRLRLAIAVWANGDYERLGGDEDDIDEIAWSEVRAILDDPLLHGDGVRPMQVMFAAAFVALTRDAHERAGELRRVNDDVREELSMRARLRSALRELRLPEAVLLENALSNLLGAERLELPDLQAARPLALEGLSRQAMDQRVSRGRKALGSGPASWPRRRRKSLFDLLRDDG
jgi:hypothetical protein